MVLGLDLDNTIICYDGLFHALALELGAIPPDLPPDKNSVRGYLWERGRNDLWTEMQGEIYGPQLHRASPFEGVEECLLAAARHNAEVYIVSHKTRRAAANSSIDLRACAQQWLEENHFWGDNAEFGVKEAFFCDPREEKIAKLAELGCEVFVDDLPEVFEEPGFPGSTEKILFDPKERNKDWDHGFRAASWDEIRERLFPE